MLVLRSARRCVLPKISNAQPYHHRFATLTSCAVILHAEVGLRDQRTRLRSLWASLNRVRVLKTLHRKLRFEKRRRPESKRSNVKGIVMTAD